MVTSEGASRIADLEGAMVGRYLLGRRLYESRATAVYRVVEDGKGPKVVKLFDLEAAPPTLKKRAYGEARYLAGVSPCGVVPRFEMFGVDRQRKLAYLVMEEVVGTDLLAVIKRLWEAGGPPPVMAELAIISGIAKGLQVMEDFCRQRGIKFVMGDLKPKHCILLPDGTVRFVDFGFAGFRRFATEGGMEVGRIYGTVRYMAPEMFKGYYAYLPQADMYSLGVIWYRMHNGRFPFSAVDAQGLCYEMEHNPFPVSDFPEQFRSLGVSLVNEDPMQRPVSFKVIVKEVDRFIKNSDETPVLLQVLMQGWR